MSKISHLPYPVSKSELMKYRYRLISFIIELLRAHRQEYLFREHDMLMVPFASLELEAKYKSLVTCTYVFHLYEFDIGLS